VNPYNAQREGIITGGGAFGVTTNWDNVWYSATTINDSSWTAEFAIPFKSIRYQNDLNQWRINFSRNNLKINENSTWRPVPRNFNTSTLAYCGKMTWPISPPKARKNIAIIPYVLYQNDKAFINSRPSSSKLRFGGDAKVAVTSSLNLDITVNPDFAQVDVDRQITNLSRFTLFFPEQRQFFLENSDLFSQFGFSKIRPFFSRQIGLAKGSLIPIIGGFRLSGKIDKNWRIGLMDIVTDANNIDGVQTSNNNYGVFALQRQVFGASNVGLILVNRDAFNLESNDNKSFNRIAGLDYNLLSKNNKWQGKVFYHYSFQEEYVKDSKAHASYLSFNDRKFDMMWNHEYVGENYSAEVGFVPRKAYWRLEPSYHYKFYPKGKLINNHRIGPYYSAYFDLNGRSIDQFIELRHSINFNNSATFSYAASHTFTELLAPFDVTGTGEKPISSGGYTFNAVDAVFTSNFRKLYSFSSGLNYGAYFTGRKLTTYLHNTYRFQPYGSINLDIDYNQITQEGIKKPVQIFLISPKLDFSFSTKVFLTLFTQYNTQLNNSNFNGRLQWRFKPMSDLFIVFSSNNFTEGVTFRDFREKYVPLNRSLVVKWVYWIAP
jgi:hypothetical protein